MASRLEVLGIGHVVTRQLSDQAKPIENLEVVSAIRWGDPVVLRAKMPDFSERPLKDGELGHADSPARYATVVCTTSAIDGMSMNLGYLSSASHEYHVLRETRHRLAASTAAMFAVSLASLRRFPKPFSAFGSLRGRFLRDISVFYQKWTSDATRCPPPVVVSVCEALRNG